MDKSINSSLFVNDGSFMERFKQLQQEKQQKEATVEGPKPAMQSNSSGIIRPNATVTKIIPNLKSAASQKSNASASGKLAFSLKQKSKVTLTPVKLAVEEDEEEGDREFGASEVPVKRQKLGSTDATEPSTEQGDVAPSPPTDPAVKKVADKLANFVAKNGRQFEHVTRQRNPGDTPFKFLFDTTCADYKYYEYRLIEEEKILAQAKECQASSSASASPPNPRAAGGSQRGASQQSYYQTPASALYGSNDDSRSSLDSAETTASGVPSNDPIAMMEFYMKKAAQEERKRQPKQSKDEMPPPTSLQASSKKGHHMGDYIPPEELERFLATCNDAAAQKSAKEAAERAKIQADNVGHRLLSKMGWKEGEGLGSSKSGRADPVMAGNVKLNNLGVGASNPGEVTSEDDIYDQYKKRMMLGYRYRPNPLNNPRKAYY